MFREQLRSSGLNSDLRALAGVTRVRAWTLTTFAMLALAVTLVHRQILAALAATVTSALDISDVEYGWLSSAFASAYLVGSLPGARLIQKIGPRIGMALTLGVASVAIGLHSVVTNYPMLFALRVAIGLSVAPAFPCATQTIHRIHPFKDRARGIGILYMGNSLGSAVCPPLSVYLAQQYGWRGAFFGVAVAGLLWVPLWVGSAFTGSAPIALDGPSITEPLVPIIGAPQQTRRAGLVRFARNPSLLRGSLVVAAAAPVTTVMLLWGTKYLVRDHSIRQDDVGRYLWLPALLFGSGSMIFGELRARSARTRTNVLPPRLLIFIAMIMSASMALVPLAAQPDTCIGIASIAMAGAGGLYTLATSDMLAQAPRGTIPATTGITTLTQSLVYIAISPIIGKVVEHFGNYMWVMMGAGLWVLPGSIFWLVHASLKRAPK
ncbi:MAG TPA: MFS transporter [Polyangiaceae bacterium]|nr:MFS transporter [Polyangiaceae bacterium]